MPVSTHFVSKASYRPVQHAYPSLAAATYLTWSAMIWTALLTEDQQPATIDTLATSTAHEQLQIGAYSIGNSTDINLFGHPDIRY